MSSRKRRIASDADEDELSPTKGSGHEDISGTVKKRKLNTTGSPIPSRTSATKSGFVHSLSGLFGYGKEKTIEKENGPADEEDVDELVAEVQTTRNSRKDVWDVPDEDDPPVLHPSSGRKGKGKAKTLNRIAKFRKEPTISMFETADAENAEGESVKSVRKRILKSEPNHNVTTLAKKKAGRPKQNITMPAEESDSDHAGDDVYNAVSEPESRRTSSFYSTTKVVQKRVENPPKRGRPKHKIDIELGADRLGEEETQFTTISRAERRSAPSSVSKSLQKAARQTSRTGINSEVENNEIEVDSVAARRGRPRNEEPKPNKPKQLVEERDASQSEGSELEIGQEKGTITSSSRSKRGPRKSDILKKAKQLSREAAREAMSRASLNAEGCVGGANLTGRGIHLSRRASGTSKPILDDEDKVAPSESLQNANFGHDVSTIVDSPQLPKGILTPSGRKRGPKPRKSVIFQDVEELDLGFKDLPISSSKKKLDAVETSVQVDNSISEPEKEAESDQSDEIACAVCSGLDESKFNKIILCDGCDFAVHQVCYDLPKVPRGDWFCKICQYKQDELHLDPQTTTQAFSTEIPDIEGFEDHLRAMQTVLLSRLTGNTHLKLYGHDEEMEKVHQVVKQTVLAGEGNSMLVIGARGSGKTTLVDFVIDDLADHRESFHVVKLNGFIHTDDKIALKDIWRQLGREMDIEDDSKATANDTLQSLLALLSHPSESVESEAGHTTKSVVFILDEFDLFTTHPRQTLLYNLFDIAQARKAPIVVIGLTTRVDVAEALEKRVKSRFSHRYVHLSLPRSVVAFGEICKSGLVANAEDLGALGFDVEAKGMQDFISFWQTMVNDLYKDIIFKHHLETHFYRTKSVPEFLTSCVLPLANLSTQNFPLKARAFVSGILSLSAPDSKLHMLPGLSELELAMLIAAARLDIILDTDTCNFAMVYDEYCSLTSRHKIQTSSSGITALGAGAKVWGREVALGAWERLVNYDILVPAGIGGAAARDLGAGGRMWKVDVALEEIAGSVPGLSSIMTKWCREI